MIINNYPLLRALSMQVERVPRVLAGLSESELRQPVVQSGWSPLGMSVHVREGVRGFLDEIMLGNTPDYPIPGDFEVDPGLSGAEMLERFEHVTASALEGVAHLPLDTIPTNWPSDIFGEWRLETLEEVLCHLLGETSCHLGHLDIARELIDGATWDLESGNLNLQRSLPRNQD